MILESGESYLFDNTRLDREGQPATICRYILFSSNVDQDGDRYGFVRNMKSAQDEYNARRSRALFTANSRRLIITQGAVGDIERTRAEWSRPDGVVVSNGRTPDEGIKADDATFDFAGQVKLMENAIAELDNYGPNQSLIGEVPGQSGRAIQLQQQAGMAELGPYILGYKGWKIRVYRALYGAVQKYWTAEKWIKVTDSEGLYQLVQINEQQTNPMTGEMVMVNAIGEIDVDIILDEGILVDASSLSASAKKVWRDATRQKADPAQEISKKILLEGEAAKVEETKSKVQLNYAKAQSEGMPDMGAMGAMGQPQKFELPPELQVAQSIADIEKTRADATHKQAAAYKAKTDAELAPQWAVHDARMERAQFVQDAHENARERENSRMLAHARRGGDA
jgi:hypothetical protein